MEIKSDNRPVRIHKFSNTDIHYITFHFDTPEESDKYMSDTLAIKGFDFTKPIVAYNELDGSGRIYIQYVD